jgi:hypothetical protein
LLVTAIQAFGQKFMVVNKDTLPYKDKMEILHDTQYFGDKTYYPGDTLYYGTCWTFEKINGKIFNRTDDYCNRQGLWIIIDSLGNYRTGIYKNNNETGLWKQFDRYGKLLLVTEEVYLGQDSYLVKEIDYSSGQAVTIVDKAFLSFCIKYYFIISAIFFIAFFSRYFINNKIYNRENDTNISLFYLGFPLTRKWMEHSIFGMICLFTFWFFKYKPVNRQLAIISNILSVVSLGIFFGQIIGLAIVGELH